MRSTIFISFVVIFVLIISTFSFGEVAKKYEQIELLKSTEALGVGKALTAVSGFGYSSMIYNPAGLDGSKISVYIIGLRNGYFNQNLLELLRNIPTQQPLESEQDFTLRLTEFFLGQVGKSFGGGIDLSALSFVIPIDVFTLSFGISGGLSVLGGINNPLSSAGLADLLFVGSVTPYIGGSYSFKYIKTGDENVDKYLSPLKVGLAFKFPIVGAISRNIQISDIVSGGITNLVNVDELLRSINTTLFRPDIGVIYTVKTFEDNSKIDVGLSIRDIGGINLGGTLLPTRVSIGGAYIFSLSEILYLPNMLKKNFVSLDFQDLFFGYQDKDFFRRIHIGIGSELFNLGDIVAMNLRLGVNGGYPAFGLGLKLAIITFDYALYGEELGIYAGQDVDIRNSFALSISW